MHPPLCASVCEQILGNSNGPNAAMLVLAAQIQQDRQALEELAELLDQEEQEEQREQREQEGEEEGGSGGGEELQLLPRSEVSSSPDSSARLLPPLPLSLSRSTSTASSSSTAALTHPHSHPHSHPHTHTHDILEEASASAAASLHDVRPPCPCSYDARSPKSIAAAILYQCQVLQSIPAPHCNALYN
jgi:hypothetical protein